MNRFTQCIFLLLICCLGSASIHAHHSTTGYYDRKDFIEIEGTVSSVLWRNPHVKFAVEVANDSGGVTEWEVELAALSIFRSRGFGEQFLHVGEPVKVLGNPAFNGSDEMGGANILLADGQEIIISLRGTPHFTDPNRSIVLTPKYTKQVEQEAREKAEGIYRVWSTVLNDPSFPMFKGGYPITEATAEIKAKWDPLAAERFECWEKGMPYLMITPHPFEFIRDGEDILMKFEEDDAIRRIHMTEKGAEVPDEYFHRGYSVGKWEADTLVVETTNINAPNFDDAGTPQSKNIRLVERFNLTEDEQRLDYKIAVFDLDTFTKPFELTRFWAWVPGREVGEWKCET